MSHERDPIPIFTYFSDHVRWDNPDEMWAHYQATTIEGATELCRLRREELKAQIKQEREVELAAWVRLLDLRG